MTSLRHYLGKYFKLFISAFILLLLLNAFLFALIFHQTVFHDFGDTSPKELLNTLTEDSTSRGLNIEKTALLNKHDIWAMYLDPWGHCLWSVSLPFTPPSRYSAQEVALFAKGYLQDYPVFIRTQEEGMLILGYPKDSYAKLPANYYPLSALHRMPLFIAGLILADAAALFLLYFLSKNKLLSKIEPIISAMEALGEGEIVSLPATGEFTQLSQSINKTSHLLSKQNTARANFISGVSHDLRTPLSMIMGYAARMVDSPLSEDDMRRYGEMIAAQSLKMKELIADFNLASQLEYEMQPLRGESFRLSKLLRSYGAKLLDSPLPDIYSLSLSIVPETEASTLCGDGHLFTRALDNLVQNSIRHNPRGCKIFLCLSLQQNQLLLTVADDGKGIDPDTLSTLTEDTHYLYSLDDRLNLRHGLGLILVRQIIASHGGEFSISNRNPTGCIVKLTFPLTREQ